VYYGASAKPICLMGRLLILQHLRNLNDESIVGQWAEDAYYQYFCGEQMFAAKEQHVPTELVEFRKRVGEEGIELILAKTEKKRNHHRYTTSKARLAKASEGELQ